MKGKEEVNGWFFGFRNFKFSFLLSLLRLLLLFILFFFFCFLFRHFCFIDHLMHFMGVRVLLVKGRYMIVPLVHVPLPQSSHDVVAGSGTVVGTVEGSAVFCSKKQLERAQLDLWEGNRLESRGQLGPGGVNIDCLHF